MKRYLMLVFIVGLLALIGEARAATPIPTHTPKATPTPVPNVFLYSVKFLCGLQSTPANQFKPPVEPPVKPGNYATSVNVHNFRSVAVCLAKKAAIANSEGQTVLPASAFKSVTLPGDGAFEIDCADIVSFFPAGAGLPPFIEGFVEIQSRNQLSVTGVYTSQTCNPSPTTGGCASLGQLAIEVVPEQSFTAPKSNGACP